MTVRLQNLAVILVLLIFAASCSGSESDENPSVKIIGSRDQYTVALGDTLRIESRARDDKAVSTMELRVDNVPTDQYAVPEGEKSFRTEQSWSPTTTGTYSIAVIAYDDQGQPSEPATITVNVEPSATPAPGVLPTAPAPVISAPDQSVQQADGCVYNAQLVSDSTTPDNAELAPGAEFVKTWQMHNTSTCEWGAGFQMVFVEGDQMSGPASVGVPPTPSGGTVDMEVSLRAPEQPGTYRAAWRLRTPEGQNFGEQPTVQIAVSPPIVLTSPSAPALPDLGITFVTGDLNLLVGESLELQVLVRNHGPSATELPAVVRVVLDEGVVSESTVPPLPAGGEVLALLSHIFSEPIELNIVASVDPEGKIAEVSEDNNSAQFRLVVSSP